METKARLKFGQDRGIFKRALKALKGVREIANIKVHSRGFEISTASMDCTSLVAYRASSDFFDEFECEDKVEDQISADRLLNFYKKLGEGAEMKFTGAQIILSDDSGKEFKNDLISGEKVMKLDDLGETEDEKNVEVGNEFILDVMNDIGALDDSTKTPIVRFKVEDGVLKVSSDSNVSSYERSCEVDTKESILSTYDYSKLQPTKNFLKGADGEVVLKFKDTGSMIILDEVYIDDNENVEFIVAPRV